MTQARKYRLSKKSLSHLKQVNKIVVELVKRTILITPVDFGILKNGGFRTPEMQHELYKKGYSQLDGYVKISHHQLGNAVDMVPYIEKSYTWESVKAFKDINEAVLKVWAEMEKEGKVTGVQLVWGGDWKSFKDYAHYEIKMKRR
jgi:peptidoglycan L-alanyl-D-glutamate endopeptidase CwlK